MVAQTHTLPHPPLARVHWWRLPLVGVVASSICFTDIAWKAATLAEGHSTAALDAPTSILRPLATMLVGLAAFTGVLLVPRLCVPGMLLVVGGVASNMLSLALWRAVPNPLGIHLAGGILHLNLADTCVWGGGLLFLAAALVTIWRLPAERA